MADGCVDVIGFGGAGGGGKTDLELGLALLKHRRTVIYRRTFPQLAGAIERSREIFSGFGKYNEGAHFWRLTTKTDIAGRRAPKTKRFVQFGSMQRLQDRESWRGNPFDLRVFDEAQNFLKEQVLFTMAWTRTNVPGQHVLDLLCFNPPTDPAGLWLIDYFAPWLDEKHPDPAKPGEVRWFVTMPDGEEKEVPGPRDYKAVDYHHRRPGDFEVTDDKGEKRTVTPRSRTFFKALVKDNPVYMATGYMAVLDALPEPLRSQMRDGDFSAGLEDDAWQVVPTRWVKAAQERSRKGRPVDAKGEPVPMSGLGSDIACGGADRTVLAPRYGVYFATLIAVPGRLTPDGESAAALIINTLAGSKIKPNVDIVGVGQGARTALKTAGVAINEINFAAAAHGFDKSGALRFANVRAEAYWKFRESLDPESGIGVALPEDRELLQELCAARWILTSAGIQLEPKEEIVKRIGRSPDKADAVVLAWYQAAVASTVQTPWRTA